MRIVLDTNVIIAAFAARGLCSEVFELCLADHTLILSEHILSEAKEKLITKIRLPNKAALEIIAYLRESAVICKPQRIDDVICRDKDDIRIIGAAIAGNARLIITGDEDLLVLKKYREVDIVTPREFWRRLST